MADQPIEYLVIHNAKTWLSLRPDKIDVIHLLVGDCPQFLFEVKNCFRNNVTHVYVFSFVIPTVHRIRDYIREHAIHYQPKGVIEFIFELSYPIENPTDPPLFQYSVPASILVAQEVCETLFFTDDRLEAGGDDVQIIYYYLAVLMTADNPVFNSVMEKFTSGLNEQNFVHSMLVPQLATSNENAMSSPSAVVSSSSATVSSSSAGQHTTRGTPIDLVYLYTEVIYFLLLIAEPQDGGEDLQKQVQEVLTNLCFKIGISVPKMMYRGRGWTRIHAFFKSNPILGSAFVDSVLKPPVSDRELNFIECVAMNQLKQMWQWYRLIDFHDCYVFATNPDSEAHRMPVIVEDTKEVVNLHQQLQRKVGKEKYLAFAGFYVDNEFLERFSMAKFPALLYATRKALAIKGGKRANLKWREMVASLPLHVPRLEIDLNLEIELNARAKQAAEEEKLLTNYVIISI